jgi:hypothetical protein
LGFVVAAGGRELPLLTAGGQRIVSALPLSNLSIEPSRAEPVFGLTDAVTYLSADAMVAWFLDLNALSTGHPFSWETADAVNGSHLLQSIVNLGNGTPIDCGERLPLPTALIMNASDSVASKLAAKNFVPRRARLRSVRKLLVHLFACPCRRLFGGCRGYVWWGHGQECELRILDLAGQCDGRRHQLQRGEFVFGAACRGHCRKYSGGTLSPRRHRLAPCS